MKTLSIIIVTYNSDETITGCLESIINTVKKYTYEIIISDNSEDKSVKKIVEKIGHNIIYIHNGKNYGFSKANNIGLKKARGKYILFLNPDTKVYESTIDGMIDFISRNPQCGAATCFVELPNGNLDDASHRGFPTPWNSFCYFLGLSRLFPKSRLFGGYNLSFFDLSKTHEIDSLAGSFMMVPFDVGRRLNWWDEDYFFYGEDIDFCYRIKKAGYKIYFVPEFKALHMKGVSSGIKKVSSGITKATATTKKKSTNHRFDAMQIFYKKHYKNKYSPIITYAIFLAIKLKRKIALGNIKD